MSMICEVCHEAIATVHLTEIVNNVIVSSDTETFVDADVAPLPAGEITVAKTSSAAGSPVVPGQTITMGVERNGREMERAVTLGRIPDYLLAQWVGYHMLDGHAWEPGAGETPRPFAYLAAEQIYVAFGSIVARTRTADAEQTALLLIATTRELDPDAWVLEAKTMERHLAIVKLPAKLGALLVSIFASERDVAFENMTTKRPSSASCEKSMFFRSNSSQRV